MITAPTQHDRSRRLRRYGCRPAEVTSDNTALVRPYGDESDLDQNIGRLCQYLSGSEADEDETEEEEETKRATGGRAGQRSCDVKGFSVLRMGQLQSSQKPRRYSSYQQDQRCGVGAAPWARAVRHPYAREPTEMSGVMHRDLLNFSSAACRDAFDLPMPPRRPLPPLPDEPAYEEARSVRHAAGDSTLPAGAPAYYLSTNRSQMDPRGGVDWLTKYEPLTLECNENGSFLVPSSHTDSTSMSPSGHSDAQQNKLWVISSPLMELMYSKQREWPTCGHFSVNLR